MHLPKNLWRNGLLLSLCGYDSITYGYNEPSGNSYRRDVECFLYAGGNPVSLIGSIKNGNWDNNESDAFIYHTVDEILEAGRPELTRQTSKPNIILLHAGTVNFVLTKNVTNAPERLGNLIDFITEQNPQTLLVVAQLIPNTNQTVDALIKEYNNKMPKIVAQRARAGKKVIMTSMRGVTLDLLLPDGNHPSERGSRVMAHYFYEAIVEADRQLRKTIQEDTRLRFLVRIAQELPTEWSTTIQPSSPRFERLTQAKKQLEWLGNFLQGNNSETPAPSSGTSCNLLLAPLTVISQIADYIRLERQGRVQGFCVGFLAAAAVACASNEEELARGTATAARLALCIGGVIDLDEQERTNDDRMSPENSSTWSVSFTSAAERDHLDKTIASYPQTYISCLTDIDRVTLTIPDGQFAAFAQQLAEGGLSAYPVGLRGRYHTSSQGRVAVVRELKSLCQQNEGFQFPTGTYLRLPLRSTSDGQLLGKGAAIEEVALESILVDVCRWYETVQAAIGDWDVGTVKVVSVGNISGAIPRSLKLATAAQQSLTLDDRVSPSHSTETSAKSTLCSTQPTPDTLLSPQVGGTPSMPVAVIGMACRFAKADSLEEFWSLINSGGNAVSTVPPNRFRSEELWRTPKGPFFGNFIKDADAFDHRFFHISAREAASMDPQQRLLLEVSYEAMESAGYTEGSELPGRPVGCYVGAGYVEYEDNVASENANAFSATGTIRAFVSGKVSHHFGWSGPSVVFDTACSSSAVAIHHACKALQTGDCSVAIAGGVSMITSPTFYQNLAAASFLSTSGASKAFDADANGYCRGEGAGMLVLKPLAQAVADNDRIFGTIVGSAVNQNSSCSPITVPDSGSQSDLYLQAMSNGGVVPSEVTYVEAHGTGTPVGDPIECASIRTAFGSPLRSQELLIGSVKDVIGHTEAASGVAGVIKTLLMIQHGTIPKQPNFTRLNPNIPSLEPDKLAIASKSRPWHDGTRRTALVNNYGAAGSNAAIVVEEYRHTFGSSDASDALPLEDKGPTWYPIVLSAKTQESLRSYSSALKAFLDRLPASITLGDVAYNLAHRHNSTLEYVSSWTASSLSALRDDLEAISTGARLVTQRTVDKKSKTTSVLPVVLCFGGQTGRSIHLSRDLFQSSAVLRSHLGRCDEACRSLGLPSLFPRIFDAVPVDDLVQLHAMLFSVQFASASAWLDAGLKASCVIGHSFGQLTALCVAGSLGLEDGLRLVTGRASLMKEGWGLEHGTMLAVEGGPDILDRLTKVATGSHNVDVACYNGPRNLVLAGTHAAIEAVEQVCNQSLPGLKIIRLANSHAYHSRLADPILKGLGDLAESLPWREPVIPVETCSPGQSWASLDSAKIVQHTREPVYFGEAVKRIADRHPSCVWLEAGSASPIIGMVRRALPTTRADDVLLSLDLGRADSWSGLAKASSSLWTAGSRAAFWAFHQSEHRSWRWLDLPPYQFAKTRHWIQYQPSRSQPEVQPPEPSRGPRELVERVADVNGEALFAVDAANEIFDLSVSGHAVVGQSLCPAGLYFELAIRATKSLQAASGGDSTVPHIEQLHIQSPLGLRPEGALFIALARQSGGDKWSFTFFSSGSGYNAPTSQRTIHARGIVSLPDAGAVTSRLQFVGRLLGTSRYDQIASTPDANRLSGEVLYKIFGRVVTYAPYYKGIRNTVAHNGEVVGDVIMPKGDEATRLSATISDPLAIDNFLQVAGIHVNCLQPGGSDDDVSVCNAIGEVLWSESFCQGGPSDSRTWKVYSNMQSKGKNVVMNDVFVLDPATGAVVMAILGAEFSRVSLASLRRVLAGVNGRTAPSSAAPKSSVPEPAVIGVPTDSRSPISRGALQDGNLPESDTPAVPVDPVSTAPGPANDVDLSVRQMLSAVFGMTVEEVLPDADLADLGVDSLMITEISSEIQKRFNVTLSMEDLQDLTDVQSLILRLGGSSAGSAPESSPEAPPQKQNGVPATNVQADAEGVAPGASGSNVEGNNGSPGVASIASSWLDANRMSFDKGVQEHGFAQFRQLVYPSQAQLVVAYTVEALAALGVNLQTLGAGEKLPSPNYLPKHEKLMAQMYRILDDAGLVRLTKELDATRTPQPVPSKSSQQLHDSIVQRFPQHAAEHDLLRTTGSRLADCLTGQAEPLSLLFGDAKSRRLMEEVYTNGPMFQAGTSFLTRLLVHSCDRFRGNREIRILELGAGTGGTTSHLAKQLENLAAGQRIRYTFSDISGSLVSAAKRKFSKYPFMEYAVINVEKEVAEQHRGRYDVIISTNCIHATPSLVRSCTNIEKMLRKDGMLCLVEHTQNLFWFDLVWGLVEGWWLFDDGRTHALASEKRWKDALHASGFSWVDWSDGASEEAKILRVITASPTAQLPETAVNGSSIRDAVAALETEETVTFKHADSLPLQADIFYPPTLQNGSQQPTPNAVTNSRLSSTALMIHGGGHIMLSRKDIRPKQTQLLLDAGFVPVSVDYRLCPETTLLEGPMTDVRDALSWIQTKLPFLTRKRPDVALSGDRVVVVGWSTGGHLALTLGWTAPSAGLRPPLAILAFYCPSDYEDECWTRKNLPYGESSMPTSTYELLDGVASSPIAAYNPPASSRAAGGWMAKGDPRSRIVLHMNWHGQTLPVLVHGLKGEGNARGSLLRLPDPTPDQIQAISPLAQIRKGSYRVPTFLVHPADDDLIPYQQAQRTADELARMGVDVELRIVDNVPHLFDLYPRFDGNTQAMGAISEGYAFLSRHLGTK
ncbi:Polyketide synthase [Purpureocillium lavendulum]|uniref:Polyketide synthase n=1 Tax=Purpureocillium lavendulum TaxID=1247861 RepID=A0AB34FV51_9HYPO|nr:Polyketide synthase [Purpureocillium lavendulum]